VYSWNGGYASHGGFTSNELKPPDEPAWNYSTNSLDYTSRANPQFWDAKSCAGAFTAVATAASPGVPPAPAVSNPNTPVGPNPPSYGVEVTSVRYDAWPPVGQAGSTTDTRESAPSMCHLVSNIPSGQGIKVSFTSWVPGAQYYNIYVNPRGCSPQGGALGFGFAKQVQATSGANVTLTGSDLPSSAWVQSVQCSPTSVPARGCNPPDGEIQSQCFITCGGGNNGLAQDPPPSALLPNGDLADENYCLPHSGISTAPCDGALRTPGAVMFYFPNNGDCLNENGNGDTYVFSGYQYNWLVLFQQHNNTSCGNTLNGGSATSYIGTVYTPASTWSINGGNRAPLSGQVIAYRVSLSGNSTIGVNFQPQYGPAPPAARLVQ
jgi:hypothetical protein